MTCPHCSSDQYSINVTCANCGIIYKALPHWVGLIDEELQPIADEYRILFGSWVIDFSRAIEAKLKEKNT